MRGLSTFTVVPILVAITLAIANMPTDIFHINAWNHGTERTEPWRTKASRAVTSSAQSVMTRLKAAIERAGGTPVVAGAAAALVMLAFSGPEHRDSLVLGMAVAGNLKLYTQKDVELRSKLRDAKVAKAAIGDTALKEDRAMTADEKTKLAEANATVLALEGRVDENAELLAAAKEANEADRNAPAVTDPDAQAAAAANKRAGITVGKDNAQDDPKRGFKSSNEQLQAIMVAGKTGQVDPRLKPLAAAGSDEQSGHTDPHGGFLLAPAFAPGILSVPAEVDPTAGRVTRIPMTNSRVVFNARVDKNHTTSVSGGLTVSRTPAAKAATASRMEFEQIELVAHDLVGAAFATNRILRESPVSFMALMNAAFGDEFAAKKLDERLNGSGAGEFAGVVSDAATVTVSKEIGQAADTIIFENVNKMMARCWRYGQAVWLVNHDALPQVTTLYMPIGTAGERVAIYAPGSEDAPFGTLLGRPIFPTEFCRTVGDKGDLVLGNWTQYLEGDYGQVEEARSIHVRFLEREECFLFVEMNDAKPWWRSALTPKYSTNTLSPFVVLEAR